MPLLNVITHLFDYLLSLAGLVWSAPWGVTEAQRGEHTTALEMRIARSLVGVFVICQSQCSLFCYFAQQWVSEYAKALAPPHLLQFMGTFMSIFARFLFVFHLFMLFCILFFKSFRMLKLARLLQLESQVIIQSAFSIELCDNVFIYFL